MMYVWQITPGTFSTIGSPGPNQGFSGRRRSSIVRVGSKKRPEPVHTEQMVGRPHSDGNGSTFFFSRMLSFLDTGATSKMAFCETQLSTNRWTNEIVWWADWHGAERPTWSLPVAVLASSPNTHFSLGTVHSQKDALRTGRPDKQAFLAVKNDRRQVGVRTLQIIIATAKNDGMELLPPKKQMNCNQHRRARAPEFPFPLCAAIC
jgi:hypothetical protein